MKYQTGFGSYFETEAVAGALPIGRNSPHEAPHGLYAEQLSGSAFTMKRGENLRTWLYRKQPSVVQGAFTPVAMPQISVADMTMPFWTSRLKTEALTPPNALRWGVLEALKESDFLFGVRTMVANSTAEGSAVHHYAFNKPMGDKFFYNADGELIFIPVEGTLTLKTEMGVLEVEPLEFAVIPRGVRFQVDGNGTCKGYLGENTGAPLRLPELGPLGSNGLANPRDFQYPTAAVGPELKSGALICKFQNAFWSAPIARTPLDVVAWHGNYAPYKYDLRRFNTMGSVSYDHPDPSIYTLLTSPSAVPGMANVDFVLFPPRWLVGENTFRPPYYHRNLMNEYMGLIKGVYDAKEGGFVPGGASLHNRMVPHGPDASTFEKESKRADQPQKIDNTMAFMFESSQVYQVSPFAMSEAPLDKNYLQCWQGLKNNFDKA